MLVKSLPARVIWTTSLLVLLSLSALTYAGLHYFELQFKEIISAQQTTMISTLAREIDDRVSLNARLLSQAASSIPSSFLQNRYAIKEEIAREGELLEIFVDGLYLLDSEGQVLAGSRPAPELKRLFARQPLFFLQFPFTDQSYISRVFSLPEKNEPLLLFSAKIPDRRGKTLGYLVGALNLLHDDLLGRLPQMRVGQKGYLYLYDKSRRILIHPDAERMMKQDVPQGVNRLFDAAIEGYVGTDSTVNSRGLKALSSFFPVPHTNWILASNYPQEEAYAPIDQARSYFWGVLAIAGGLSLLIVWQLVRQLTAPLNSLTQKVKSLTAGERTSPLELSQIHELRALGEAFNQLQADLQRQSGTIREQQRFSQDLVAGSALPCFVIDAEHRVLLWNRACEELTGVSADSLVGTRDHCRAFYPDTKTCLADQIIEREKHPQRKDESWIESKMVPGGLQGECWIKNLNGHDRYIFFNAAPIRNQEGELVAVIENIEDLTDARLSHEEMARTLSLLEATFESTADGLVIEDLCGRVLRYNRRALQMWHFEGDESLIRNKRLLIADILEQVSDPRAYQDRLRQIHANPEGESFDTLEFKDGRIFERYSRPQVLDDKVIGRVWSYHDISQRRRLEDRLQQAQKMEAVGQLAGGVAHDFNNLLTVINGYGSLLTESPSLGSRERGIAELVLQAGEKAADLTGQLLAFGRRQILKPRTIDLNELIRRNEKILRHLLREDMEIVLSLASDLGLIKVDPTQLEQILINLVVNARDAMKSGGRLSISTCNVLLDDEFVRHHPGSVGGNYALIQVRDQGCGMSSTVLERIFEPFFTTKEKGQGTGLGLATVYGIVKQSRGYLNVESEVGSGSCFSIYLPLTDDLLIKAQRKAKADVSGAEKILVVEDESTVLDLVASALKSAGYQVRTASGPNIALEVFNLAHGEFELLLTDMVMPEMTGQQLALLLGSKNPEMKVLYMSGYGEQHFDELDESAVLLAKPFAPDVLLSAVRKALT